MLTSEESKKLWDLVEPLETAMLVTYEQGVMQARPMHLVQKKFEGTFYFFTENPTEKTEEINQHQDVCLAFSCPKAQTYVSISGKASLFRDQELIDQLWNPFVAAWFPQGKDDASVTLLKIESYQAEYWQGKDSRVTQLFKYASAYLSGKRPNIGEHGRL
ncbi:General stress protein 26 [Legionella beliardensis]|uniref:General stress protein 26 n=1 Tax=Legionella beliardensis TaxID=91822 RepID=A0A378JPE8_9GAMM|nr:pyridoxamine 5'-phosphate oxidase family protein [Legionella beliardensis]STX55634.1 General stress protein 26 [Legionella beliardensis]